MKVFIFAFALLIVSLFAGCLTTGTIDWNIFVPKTEVQDER